MFVLRVVNRHLYRLGVHHIAGRFPCPRQRIAARATRERNLERDAARGQDSPGCEHIGCRIGRFKP